MLKQFDIKILNELRKKSTLTIVLGYYTRKNLATKRKKSHGWRKGKYGSDPWNSGNHGH